jgi:hypothetical protein
MHKKNYQDWLERNIQFNQYALHQRHFTFLNRYKVPLSYTPLAITLTLLGSFSLLIGLFQDGLVVKAEVPSGRAISQSTLPIQVAAVLSKTDIAGSSGFLVNIV